MNDGDERLRRYLRSRADVPVPDNVRWPSMSERGRHTIGIATLARSIGLVAAVIVAAVILRAVLAGLPSAGGPGPSEPAIGTSASPSSTIAGGFPSSVAGMPVLSVAEATALVRGGDIDGRAIAVGGYYFDAVMSCPAPSRYYGPLEQWCGFVTLADDAASATLCTFGDNSASCHPPSGTHLVPMFMPETSGRPGGSSRVPTPMVLIGHAGDARAWQCGADTQATCATAFVVDRLAWSSGDEIPLSPADPWDELAQQRLVPQLNVDEAIASLGGRERVLAAVAMRARDIWTVDPRWNLAGEQILWVVRSIESGDPSANAARSVIVSLVADATGTLVDSHDLAVGADYRPARLWTITTADAVECCGGSVQAFFRVRASDGTTVHDGLVQGAAHGTPQATTFGPGTPLVLPPGSYSVSSWLAPVDRGVVGSPSGECSTQVTLGELDDVMLEAHFATAGQRCAFAPPSALKLSY